MSYTATFDGHDLSTLFTVGRPERTLVGWEPNLIDGASSAGAFFAGTKAQPVEVTIPLTTIDGTDLGRMTALRTLAGWLAVSKPRALVLSDERVQSNGTVPVFRYAVPKGAPKIDPAINADTLSVTFVCADPLLHAGNGVELTSYQSFNSSPKTLTIVGTAPTYPIFVLKDVRGDSNGLFRMHVTSGDDTINERITFDADPSPAETLNVTVNCKRRTARTDANEPVAMALSSGWPRFTGGQTVTLTVEKGSIDHSTSSVIYNATWW